MTKSLKQLTLPFPLNEQCVFDNFVTGSNGELVHALQNDPSPGRFSSTWVWGGDGKSHLLQATCQSHAQLGLAVAYLPLADTDGQIESLQGLNANAVIALDDLDSWLGNEALEAALFTLYQELYSSGKCLLLASLSAPAKAAFALPDLASRFRASNCHHVEPLDDDGKKAVLGRRAAARGLQLPQPVMDFWLRRSDRSLRTLLGELDRLDEAAMAEQRQVTVPLLKQVLRL